MKIPRSNSDSLFSQGISATITSPLSLDYWQSPPIPTEPALDDTAPTTILPELRPQTSLGENWLTTGPINRGDDFASQIPNSVELPGSMPSYDALPTTHVSVQDRVGQLPAKASVVYDKQVSHPASGGVLTHGSQSEGVGYHNAAGNMSRVSFLSTTTADSAPSSRDPSIFSKGSSIWSADTTFTNSSSSTDFSQTRDAVPSENPLSSKFPIRRKPIGSVKSHSSLSPSAKKACKKIPFTKTELSRHLGKQLCNL